VSAKKKTKREGKEKMNEKDSRKRRKLGNKREKRMQGYIASRLNTTILYHLKSSQINQMQAFLFFVLQGLRTNDILSFFSLHSNFLQYHLNSFPYSFNISPKQT
jgi:hypothetical protein